MRRIENKKQIDQIQPKKRPLNGTETRSTSRSSRNLLKRGKSSSTQVLKQKEPTKLQFSDLDGDSVINILDYYGGHFDKEASTYQLFTQKKFMKRYYGRLKNGNVVFLFRNATINLSCIRIREEVISFLAGVLRAKNRIEIYRDQFKEYLYSKSESVKANAYALLLKRLGDHCKKIEHVDFSFIEHGHAIYLLDYIPKITKLTWYGPLTSNLVSKVASDLEFLECIFPYSENAVQEGVLEQCEKLNELKITCRSEDMTNLFKSFNNMPNLRLVTLKNKPKWDDFPLLINSTIDRICIQVTESDRQSALACKQNIEKIAQWKLSFCEIKEGQYNIFYQSHGSFHCIFHLIHVSKVPVIQ